MSPYVQNVSEAAARVFRKHNVSVTVRPHSTLRKAPVHPKDKVESENVWFHAKTVTWYAWEKQAENTAHELLNTRKTPKTTITSSQERDVSYLKL